MSGLLTPEDRRAILGWRRDRAGHVLAVAVLGIRTQRTDLAAAYRAATEKREPGPDDVVTYLALLAAAQRDHIEHLERLIEGLWREVEP